MSGDKLEKVSNEHARHGWQLKTITAAQVIGRIGPGDVEGVVVTFAWERTWSPGRRLGAVPAEGAASLLVTPQWRFVSGHRGPAGKLGPESGRRWVVPSANRA